MFNIFGKNDWYPVWSEFGLWTFTNIQYGFKVRETRAIYEILYSPSRKEYKLKLSGDDPKGNSKYHEAVQKLNEFIKNGHE